MRSPKFVDFMKGILNNHKKCCDITDSDDDGEDDDVFSVSRHQSIHSSIDEVIVFLHFFEEDGDFFANDDMDIEM